MRASLVLGSAATLLVAAIAACGESGPYKTPASDKNFDDPDDPGSSGEGDPFKKDASPDANATGRFCVADRDCPAAFRCMYPVAAGCSASGTCQPFDATKCLETTACGCGGTLLSYCLPAGSAPAAVSALGSCDGGAPIDSGSGDAAPADATAE